MQYNLNNTASDILRGYSVSSSILAGSGTGAGNAAGRTTANRTVDVYLRCLETGEEMQLSYVPETVKATEGALFQTYNIIERGEVKLPKGEKLSSVSWDAILPGEKMKTYPFVKEWAWEKPETIIQRWNAWKKKGAKLNLLITQTGVNLNVYLESFHETYSGGLGSIKYSISFLAAKELLIGTVGESVPGDSQSGAPPLNNRAEAAQPSTVTAGAEDNLWTMAQRFLGDGAEWERLLQANTDRISDPDMLSPGTVLTLR